MYLRNKEELESLQAKRTQVENDRRQISAVINELDVQKKAALEDTWRKVGVEGGGGARGRAGVHLGALGASR
jgi:chromosome segregation ATPase